MVIIFFAFLLPLLFSVSISTPSSELTALMSIKASLDPQNQVLTSWTTSTLSSSSELCDGSFEGVACNELGHVTNISLQGKGLNGKIPLALSELKDLTGLYLHFNALSGPIPKEIGKLSKLTDLYLNVNQLSGNIPPQIGNMSNLQVVQLCYNKLSGSVPTELSSLKNLDVLALQYNHLTGAIPATLGLLTTLTRLDLSFNNLFGPIPVTVANAPMLRVLDVRNNTLSGNVPQALKRLGGGFQYQNNPNLCGVGFPNIANCPANLNPDKPQPLGPDTLLKKNIPESVNLKPNCHKPTDISCPKSSHKKHHTGVVLGAVLAITAFTAIVSLAVFSWHRRQKQKIGGTSLEASETDHVSEAPRRRRSPSQLISLEYSNGWDPLGKGGSTGSSALSQEVFESFMFNLEDVERATQCFSEANLLGKSKFSSVYKGVLRDGSSVAVKCIAKTSCKSDEEEFVKGLKMLVLLKHGNLVRLRGFCCSKGRRECFLIYEYVPNGNLLQYLDVDPGTGKVLDWSTRITIINGIAQGIDYVHGEKGKKPAQVHQNISAEKVLIDHWNNPLVADSGLHKLLADDILFSKLKEAAAMGYLAPEYVTTGRFTDKSDVYAFGIIIFQILSGKSHVTTRQAPEMMSNVNHDDDFIIDPNLDGNFVEDEAVKLRKIALLCTHDSPSLRPSMESVVKELASLNNIS